MVSKIRYDIELEDFTGTWVAKEYHDTGDVFFGQGNTPIEAMQNVKSENLITASSSEEKDVGVFDIVKIIPGNPFVKYVESVPDTSEEVDASVEKKEFKPLDVVKNQVCEFIDTLAGEDKCKVNISTEIYLGATSNGAERVPGDIYLALVARKSNSVKDGCVLQESMPYPAKEVFNYFDKVDSNK